LSFSIWCCSKKMRSWRSVSFSRKLARSRKCLCCAEPSTVRRNEKTVAHKNYTCLRLGFLFFLWEQGVALLGFRRNQCRHTVLQYYTEKIKHQATKPCTHICWQENKANNWNKNFGRGMHYNLQAPSNTHHVELSTPIQFTGP